MKAFRLWTALSLAVISLGRVASAVTVFDSYGSVDVGFSYTGKNSTGNSVPFFSEIDTAYRFVPSATISAPSAKLLLSVPLDVLGPTSVLFNIRIAADSSGSPTTSYLAQQTFTYASSALSTPTFVQADFSGSLTLQQSVPYWAWVSAEGNATVTWIDNEAGVAGTFARANPGIDQNSGSWFVSPNIPNFGAFTVTGTLVPEPSRFVLALIGVFCLFWSRRRAFAS